MQIICLPEADQLCSLPVGNYEFGSLVDINCRAWSNVYNSLSIKYRKQIEICLQSYPLSNPPIEICESFGHSENKIKVPIDANVQPGSFNIITKYEKKKIDIFDSKGTWLNLPVLIFHILENLLSDNL